MFGFVPFNNIGDVFLETRQLPPGCLFEIMMMFLLMLASIFGAKLVVFKMIFKNNCI